MFKGAKTIGSNINKTLYHRKLFLKKVKMIWWPIITMVTVIFGVEYVRILLYSILKVRK